MEHRASIVVTETGCQHPGPSPDQAAPLLQAVAILEGVRVPTRGQQGPGGRTSSSYRPAALTMASTSDHPKPTVSPATVRVNGSTKTKNG